MRAKRDTGIQELSRRKLDYPVKPGNDKQKVKALDLFLLNTMATQEIAMPTKGRLAMTIASRIDCGTLP